MHTIKTDLIDEPFGDKTPQQLLDRMFSNRESEIDERVSADVARQVAETRDAMGRLLDELFDAGLLSLDAVANITETSRDQLLPYED